MNEFEQIISTCTVDVLQRLHPSTEWTMESIGDLIENPPNEEMGDYAIPCFSFARILRKSPQIIASNLEELLEPVIGTLDQLSQVKAQGPYLNFKVNIIYMAGKVIDAI